METSGATKGDQCELAGISSALDRDNANGFLHGRVHNPNYAGSELLEREIGSMFFQPFPCDLASAGFIEREISAKEFRRSQASKKKIRIGDRRLQAAAVADWTGIRSCGLGPDAQRAAGIETRQRASPRTHGVDVEHGNANRESRNLPVCRSLDYTFGERDVGRGASHIERDYVFKSAGMSGRECANHPSSGSRQNCTHRFADRRGQRSDPSRALHHEDPPYALALRLSLSTF